jgi:hypothetical protein
MKSQIKEIHKLQKLIELCQNKNIKVNIVDQRGDSIPFKQSKNKQGFFSKLFGR